MRSRLHRKGEVVGKPSLALRTTVVPSTVRTRNCDCEKGGRLSVLPTFSSFVLTDPLPLEGTTPLVVSTRQSRRPCRRGKVKGRTLCQEGERTVSSEPDRLSSLSYWSLPGPSPLFLGRTRPPKLDVTRVCASETPTLSRRENSEGGPSRASSTAT